jgi:septum formation inhibitor MinC
VCCAAGLWPERAKTPKRESFCSRLEAELVSIGGRYLVSEQLPADRRNALVQIALVDDELTITRN